MLKIKTYLQKIPITLIVFIFVLSYRIPSLGFDLINNDDGWWKSRGYAFSSALSSFNLEGTAPTYHPGVTLLWSQFSAIKAYGILHDFGFTPEYFGISEYFLNHFLQNLMVVLFTSILLTILYLGLSKIVGRFYSLLFILILSGEPFFTALSRTIHLDAILSITMFTSFVYYYLALKNGSRNSFYIYVSGIMAGLALLTKSPAMFLLPFYLIPFIIERKKEFLIIYIKTMVVAALTFFFLWPAMWIAPIQTINSYLFKGVQGVGIEEGHKHFWFGEEVNDPGFWFYPIVLIGRYSSFLFLGMLPMIWFIFKRRERGFFFYSLLYLVGYILMIMVVSKKMDRYSLPAVFAMASLFVGTIINLKLDRKVLKIASLVYGLTIVVIYFGIHPYYLAYYSPLVGGYDYGMRLIEPQWPVAYAKVADYFNKKDDPEKIKVALLDHFYIREFAKFEALDLADQTERQKADYIVLPSYREDVIYHYTHLKDESYKSTEEISVAGVSFYRIYKKEVDNE
jgi:4-amino-4-deoxy-L-arabinose transferase-like glycosyltransferase